jgi:hypothetical protein
MCTIYITFLWPPLEAALPILNIAVFRLKTFYLDGINTNKGDGISAKS